MICIFQRTQEHNQAMASTIEFKNLTKNFGTTVAVNNLSFTVEPGRVTGFLGPNGSGKSTSLRALTGLITPTSGSATINGKLYNEFENPLTEVGSALDATSFHPGRSGFNNLAAMADAAGISSAKVWESIEQVGMTSAAKNRVETYSLGMKQRLAIAGALIGDPKVLLLDEPANGLDPEGIAWMRGFLQYRASLGHTVLISSHVLSEVQQTVDDVVIIRKGELVKACSLAELVASASGFVEVVSPEIERLATQLHFGWDGITPSAVHRHNSHTLHVEGLPIALVGKIAAHNNIELHGLKENNTDLEQVFLNLTGDAA
jgi:ABC-2 type transport system ATP-binding protein